jgi:hypothetical protein
MWADTFDFDPAPLFDSLVAEEGNPLGAYRDMPVPRFQLGMAPLTRWPSLADENGELPTVEIPAHEIRNMSAMGHLASEELRPPLATEE